MVSPAVRLVARLLWLAPALLLVLTLVLGKAAFDQHETWTNGQPATAEVVHLETSDRVDVTLDQISLRIRLEDGRVVVKEGMSLPKTLVPRLEGAPRLQVHVRPGAAQEVVIDRLMPAHWIITASNAGMALLGFLLVGGGVLWWNLQLRKADRGVQVV